MLLEEKEKEIARNLCNFAHQFGDWHDYHLSVDDCMEVVQFVVSAYEKAVHQPPSSGSALRNLPKLKVTLYIESIQDDPEG